jgi:hypothetical protein
VLGVFGFEKRCGFLPPMHPRAAVPCDSQALREYRVTRRALAHRCRTHLNGAAGGFERLARLQDGEQSALSTLRQLRLRGHWPKVASFGSVDSRFFSRGPHRAGNDTPGLKVGVQLACN